MPADGIKQQPHAVNRRHNQNYNFVFEHRVSQPTEHAEALMYYDSRVGEKHLYYCVNDSLPTYVRVLRGDTEETISGNWLFQPGSGDKPFSLHSSATGVVQYLNADMLDTYHASKSVVNNTVAVRNADGTLSAADPSANDHLVTLGFFTTFIEGRDPKDPCDVATTASINLASAPSVIDTYSPNPGDRIFVWKQADPSENGIYIYPGAGLAMTRSLDANEDHEVTSGMQTFIRNGDAHIGAVFMLRTQDPIDVGTTDLEFVQIGGNTLYGPGRGLKLDGNTFHFAQVGAYTVGSLFYALDGSNVSQLVPVVTGNVLKSNGDDAVPVWGKVSLTADVAGVLGVANGGTGSGVEQAQGAVTFYGANGILSADHANFRYGTTYGQFAGKTLIAGDVAQYQSTNFGAGLFVSGLARIGGEVQITNAYNLVVSSTNVRGLTISRSATISGSVNLQGIYADLSVPTSTLGAGTLFGSDYTLRYTAGSSGASVNFYGHKVNAYIQTAALTVGSFVGFESQISTQGAGSVFTNAKHFRAILNGAGTSNEFGYYVEGAPGAGSFAFYNPTDAKSYFKGSVLIGGTYASPGATLDINGTLRVQSLATGTGDLLLTHEGGIVKTRTVNPGVWTTFTAGSVIFAGASGELAEDNAGLFFDAINNRLGVAINDPDSSIETAGDIHVGGELILGGQDFRLVPSGSTAMLFENSQQTLGQIIRVGNNAASIRMRQYSSVGTAATIPAYSNFADTNTGLYFPGADQVGLSTGGVGRLIVDSAGNVGVGTADIEAWDVLHSAVEFSRSAIMAAKSGIALYILSNAYYDGAWKYKTSSTAGRAYWSGGQYFIAVAASGTIDTTITWTSALTVGNNGAVSLGVLANSSSNSVITEASGLLQKRTIDSRVWGSSLVDGSGTATYLPKWSDGDTLTSSTISDDGTNVTIASRSLILQTVNKHLIGGIGTNTTSGTLDWNDVSNCRSGNGNTLLLGSATNGPGPATYFHSFGFEYSSKDGTGNITQLAIPYAVSSHITKGFWYRSINGTSKSATAWAQIWTSDTDGANSGLDADLLDGQEGSYYLTAGNIGGLTAYRVVISGSTGSLQTNSALQFNGNGLGVQATPTAWLTLGAGTAAANTAPLKFTSGPLMTTPEVGAVEFSNETEPALYFTRKSGVRRRIVMRYDQLVGDTTNTSFSIPHSLGAGPVSVTGRLVATGEEFSPDWDYVDDNTVSVTFMEVLSLNEVLITVAA